MKTKKKETLYIFTDGSCYNNGKKNAAAGYGVYIKNKNIKLYGFINKKYKQNNNIAELQALSVALEYSKKHYKEYKNVKIFTDSIFSLKEITKNKLKDLDKNSKDIALKARKIYKNKKKYIKLHYVKAHTGKQDIISKGNETADKLAKKGAKSNVLYIEKNKRKKIIFKKINLKIKDKFKNKKINLKIKDKFKNKKINLKFKKRFYKH